MVRPIKPAGPAPTSTYLREVALRHLAQFSATEAGLVRVLERRVQRWARAAAAEGQDVQADLARAVADARAIATSLVQSGIIDDVGFAAARAARLVRAGRSRMAIAANLVAKGVPPETVASSLPERGNEVHAALALARRRRLGPFRVIGDARPRQHDLAILGRAGFDREAAEQALDMPADEAEALVIALRNR